MADDPISSESVTQILNLRHGRALADLMTVQYKVPTMIVLLPFSHRHFPYDLKSAPFSCYVPLKYFPNFPSYEIMSSFGSRQLQPKQITSTEMLILGLNPTQVLLCIKHLPDLCPTNTK